jgi:Flp pilus assembly protein TadG
MRLHTLSRSRPATARPGVAAVEVAIITAFFLVPLVIGVWEVGRMVQVQQVVANAAREGARTAAQAYTINSSGTPTQVMVSSGSVNVTDTVYRYLIAAGFTNLQRTDVTVTFQFNAPRSDGTMPTEPYLGEKGEPFSVTVTIPWNRVRWVNLGLVNPTSVTFTVTWRMLVDAAFTIDDTLPTW